MNAIIKIFVFTFVTPMLTILALCLIGSVPANCTDGQIRLKGGLNQREGRVEICYGNVWGTICDTQWDYRDAQVVCKQLNFTANGESNM